MNIFLDENIPGSVKEHLKEPGCHVFDVRCTADEGKPDKELFAMAKANNALFITTDKDFFHTIHFEENPHFGIVFIALAQPNSQKILDKAKWFLRTYSDEDFRDTCYLLTDRTCRIYT